MRFCVFSGDPLYKYYQKGELRTRYWNPKDLFDEVTVFSFCDRDIEPDKVQTLVGRARLEIIPLGYPRLTNLVRQYRNAWDKLRALSPDLVRVHSPWHGIVGVRCSVKLGIPVLLSLHTHYGARRLFERGLKLQALKAFEWYCASKSDAVLAVSQYVAEYARTMGAENISVIYNRVYGTQFCKGSRPSNVRPVVLSVGRLDPPKNQECLIRAIVDLDVQLVLVGDGVNRPALESLTDDLGLRDRVDFRGFLQHGQLPEVYQCADIFAIATNYEGFCIPVLEAMASGLPIIASDTPPIPEIMGGCGVIVKQTPEAFRNAIGTLVSDSESALAMGNAARRRAKEIDGNLQEEKEAELYLSLAKCSSPASG